MSTGNAGPYPGELLGELRSRAAEIRRRVVQMVYDGGSGHCGGSLSVADILAALYFRELRLDPDRPHWPERDRFVLSKGHACPALYAALAGRGFFDPADLTRFRHLGSPLKGHPERCVPGVETVTGSLGQGISAALGMALGLRRKGSPGRVYAVVGDGEMQEGQVWEALMAAGHFRLDNFTCFVDRNRLQGDGRTEEILDLEPLAEKLRAFRWHVQEIDGHDMAAILGAIDAAKRVRGQPQIIVANTVKGKGVSYMESVPQWHGTAPPTDPELATALAELGAEEAAT